VGKEGDKDEPLQLSHECVKEVVSDSSQRVRSSRELCQGLCSLGHRLEDF
jgi:hypothetical protein